MAIADDGLGCGIGDRDRRTLGVPLDCTLRSVELLKVLNLLLLLEVSACD